MEFVVEDPGAEDGLKTYEPELWKYEQDRGMWSLIFEKNGEDVERQIPRERIVYTEGEPEV
jgi:hypothetical protein